MCNGWHKPPVYLYYYLINSLLQEPQPSLPKSLRYVLSACICLKLALCTGMKFSFIYQFSFQNLYKEQCVYFSFPVPFTTAPLFLCHTPCKLLFAPWKYATTSCKPRAPHHQHIYLSSSVYLPVPGLPSSFSLSAMFILSVGSVPPKYASFPSTL